MNTRNIDKTHIIALKEEDGKFRNTEIPIDRPEQFIAELQAMVDNSNRTVWDMQSHFTSRFSKTSSYMDYIHPYSYSDSYVGGIQYPKMSEYSELHKSWSKAGSSAREKYLAACKGNGKTPEVSVANEEETKAIESFKTYQKHNFFRKAMRWIDASCYQDTASQLNRSNSVKMYSTENIGWNSFEYQISKDIKIALNTNFGFGSAAYFLLGAQYKGIDILPYSYIVKYYKANMADIVRCTRSYSPCRESWLASFDFFSDFINKSKADPEDFVESYIMREVTEMMQGLEAIANNPKIYIERIGNMKADPYVINVRPMFSDERTRMQSYPDETPILFKVEKITGALKFLKSLTAIAKEVNSIQPHIDRLLEINMSLYPEVQDAITKIRGKIDEQTSIKSNLETQITVLSEKLDPFEEEVSKLRAEATQERPFIMSAYEASHPEYVKLKTQKYELQAQLYNANRLIDDFNSFVNVLDRSLTKIDEVKSIKEAA